jgi:hypothetical protein
MQYATLQSQYLELAYAYESYRKNVSFMTLKPRNHWKMKCQAWTEINVFIASGGTFSVPEDRVVRTKLNIYVFICDISIRQRW